MVDDKKYGRKDDIWEKDFAIRVNPRKTLKGVILILVLVMVFFAGRWTMGSGEETASEGSSSFDLPDFSLTGMVIGVADKVSAISGKGSPAEEAVPEAETTAAPAAPAPASLTPSPASTPASPAPAATGSTASSAAPAAATANTSQPAAAEDNEPIVTQYSRVALALNDAKVDWRDTWGKITKLDYTIKNNEAGTILPSYFIMMVEGYPDDGSKKRIDLPQSSQRIKAGTSVRNTATVPNGFAYNEINTGKLDSVEITLILFDGMDRPMTQVKKPENLQGTE